MKDKIIEKFTEIADEFGFVLLQEEIVDIATRIASLYTPEISDARIDEMVDVYQPLSYNTGTGAEKRIRSYFKDGIEAGIKELNNQ